MIPHMHFDPEEITTCMAQNTTLRLLLAIAASYRMYIEQIDIEATYLHETFAHNDRETEYVR